MATHCVKCGVKKGIKDALMSDIGATHYLCPDCDSKIKRDEQARIDKIKQAAAKVIVTTTHKVDGTQVVAYLGIESVEYVIGTAIFSELSTELADFFGARSTAFEKKLQAAKQHTMDVLKFRAAEKGANAVIGIDMDYAEFSGNRVALILNGTLVKLVALGSRSQQKASEPDI